MGEVTVTAVIANTEAAVYAHQLVPGMRLCKVGETVVSGLSYEQTSAVFPFLYT